MTRRFSRRIRGTIDDPSKPVFMKKILFLASLIMSVVAALGQGTATPTYGPVDPGKYDDTWWNRQPIRLVQTNFPAIYGKMDIDEYVNAVTDMGANVLLFNTGGIVANYQTRLEAQYRNPHIGDRDFVRELIDKLHDKGVRYIARFDFSKLHPSIAEKHPEWLYVGTNGQNQVFNGLVSACINGEYYQKKSLEILREVIENYPIDGVFFNMMGYTGSTYAGENHGICQCDNCRHRFHERTGLELPKDANDPNIAVYRQFQRETSYELYTTVTSYIRKLNKDLVIYNYNDVGTSWIASESGGTPLRDGAPYPYNATNNVKPVLGSYNDVVPVNLTMGFQAIGYRSVLNNANLLRNWMLENMLHGAPLGFVVVGTLNHYEDRVFFPDVKEIYSFHQRNEPLFTNVESAAQVALIQDRYSDDARGMIRLLTEEHIPYDIINPAQLTGTRLPRSLDSYKVVIVNNLSDWDENIQQRIQAYVDRGGKVLAMGTFGMTASGARKQPDLRLFGVKSINEFYPSKQATYLKRVPTDSKLVPDNAPFSLMMMNADFLKCEAVSDAEVFFRLLPTNLYGPAEVTWYEESEITSFPGVIYNAHGNGKTVLFPWRVGAEYEQRGNYAHRTVVVAAIERLLGYEPGIRTDLPASVELTHLKNRNNQFEWIGLINHSGHLGTSVREPITIRQTEIRFRPNRKPTRVHLVRAGVDVPFRQEGEWVVCTVPEVREFEMLLCGYN